MQAVTDIPAVLFADELVDAYKDAKVVLTERDVEGWIKSVSCSQYHSNAYSEDPGKWLLAREMLSCALADRPV